MNEFLKVLALQVEQDAGEEHVMRLKEGVFNRHGLRALQKMPPEEILANSAVSGEVNKSRQQLTMRSE